MFVPYTLIKKERLTYDVFLLIFKKESVELKEPLAGQFITFLVPNIGGRAYSILESDGEYYTFIIKRLENGRGGSKAICDMDIGMGIQGVGPVGHFILQKNHKNKLFIGTGTGLVPLYNQVIGAMNSELNCELHLIFGVRKKEDIFLEDKLEEISKRNGLFSYNIFLSQDEGEGYIHGRNTQYLIKENVEGFQEFYICGISSMVDTTLEILEMLGIDKKQIFTERY